MARGFNYAPGASAEVQVAMRPELSKDHVMVLGASRNNLVRATIASRPDCPMGLMVTLAHDFSAEVRICVARNPRASRTVMAYLSADRSADVVRALVDNPALSAELLADLAFHKKREVRAAAAARLDDDRPVVADAHQAEDVHTPELAEHVVPIAPRMTADGSVASPFAPVNVVDINTGEPIPPMAAMPAPAYPVAQVDSAAASGGQQGSAIPQIFSPHSTPETPAPTRTAPVRGFKPKP